MQVMPSRVEALKDDISRSRRRHRALLKTLFDTTLSTLELNDVQQPQYHDLNLFLEVNEISTDRCFNHSTLPPTDSLLSSRYVNAPPADPYESQVEPDAAFDISVNRDAELLGVHGNATDGLKEDNGSHDPATAHLADDKSSVWLTNGNSIPSPAAERLSPITGEGDVLAADAPIPTNSHEVSLGSALRSSEPLPLSFDVESMAPSASKEPVAEERLDFPRNIHLSPRDEQEERFENFDPESDDGKMHGGSDVASSQANPNGLTPPTSDEDIKRHPSEEGGQVPANESRSHGTLKTQPEIARVEPLSQIASTPDDQLRFEEAQTMQSPQFTPKEIDRESRSMPPPASLSSAFVHDDVIDDVAMPDVLEVNNEVNVEQNPDPQLIQDRQNDSSTRHTVSLRDHVLPGMNRDSSRDLTLSRRPPMRIDTGASAGFNSINTATCNAKATVVPTSSGTPTPSKATPAVSNAPSPPERMTTRVSSGAIRHKSVSEILGETPKAIPIQADKGIHTREVGDFRRDDQNMLQTPKSASSSNSPDPIAFKQRLNELKENQRSKLSTVIFANSRNTEATQAQHLGEDETPKEDRDYLLTLFNFQVSNLPKTQSLNGLVKGANKTLTTADHFTDFNERQACRVLNKIYELQARNCWSLRQLERSAEPPRRITHWDVLVSEMKWMRTDFREERKWKLAAAKFTADACAVWVAGTSKDRKSLQVRIRAKSTNEKSILGSASPPDLVHSTDDETSEATDDDFIHEQGSAPAAIFSLPPEMFVFGLNQSPVAEKLLLELPIYQPHADLQHAALRITDLEPDAAWKKAVVPISKYAQGKLVTASKSSHSTLVTMEEGPPRKKSRFNYYETDNERQTSTMIPEKNTENMLEPEQDDVALFDPEHKHIRDRIHTGHAFRPPSEYIMPSQSFFESRQSSQWTQAEDDELRRIVKEYSYNWSLISSCMTFPSVFSSGPERRTPWECFERWISLEGLPVEMAKINYFRAYHSRLQAAQKTVEANQLAQQQQQGGNASQLPLRKRSTQPYSVERRKEQRHLHVVEAMRKLTRKKETAQNKQQHIANITAMRKAAQEGPKPRREMHTPQEFSRLKYNQQIKMEENARQYRAQVLQQQKATQAARANQQTGQQPNGMQPVRNPVPGPPNGISANANAVSVHGQIRGPGADPSRPAPSMQRNANSQANGVLPAHSHGVPHAPMQANAQMPTPMQPRVGSGAGPDTRVMQEVSRVQAQQLSYQQQQQIRQQSHVQPNGHAGSPNMQHPNLLSHNNAAMSGTSLQGHSSPSINGVPPPAGASTSPRLGQPQALSSGMTPAVNHISAQIKTRHPQASPEQITRMTTDQLYKMSTQHAMQAAAGNANVNAVNSNSNVGLQAPSPMQHAAMMANSGSPILNPAHYAQIMRTQQASQQRGANPGNGQGINGSVMNGSRSVTPLIQRTSSGQGGPRLSQSPSARPVGLAK